MAKTDGPKTSSHVCHHPFPKLRRENAAKQQVERAARTPAQQLAHLDKLLGPGVGAQRERARLAKVLATPPAAAVEAKPS